MKHTALVIAALAATASTLVGQTARAHDTVWPKRIAVGMRSGDQLAPITVEATPTGWISINFLSTRPDGGLPLPAMRMMTDARDLQRWTTKVRAFLQTIDDTTAAFDPRQSVLLGNGRYVIEINRWPSRGTIAGERKVLFSVRGCGPSTGTSGPSVNEVRGLLALLDSAVMVAGGGEGRPPTLSRPYYASEVSCPALPNASNSMPRSITQPAAEVGAEVGAQFIVDTTGRVERGSIHFLPGTQSAAARAASTAMRDWRFTPAEIDGTPVRQVVQMSVAQVSSSFAPQPRTTAGGRAYRVDATDDGWVHLTDLTSNGRNLIQEWFDPDSVDAWVARVRALNRVAAALPRDTEMLVDRSTPLGSPDGIRFGAGFFRHGRALEMRAGLTGCAGAFTDGENPVGEADAFADAARDARGRRRPPADPRLQIHSSNDVACSAWLPWLRSTQPGFGQVWRYPVGLYPSSMRVTNARADVLVSFVVDTTGMAELSTLAVMAGSDGRAVEAIPATLRTLRFRPATRAGRTVRQRVIQTIRFEPPPTCFSRNAAPACPRRYSDR